MNTVTEYKTAIDREVKKWPGARVEYRQTAKHVLAIVSYKGRTNKTLFAKTASDWRGLQNTVSTVRRKLRAVDVPRYDASNDN